jgi:putative proteasome-type protease
MTYCGSILMRDGLVIIADTRTNAGLDNISTFLKLPTFCQRGERVMILSSSGNLSLSQSDISMLNKGMKNPATGELDALMNAPTLFQAAQRIGHAIRHVQQIEGHAHDAADVKFDVSFLFGGQIKGDRLRLYIIYSHHTSRRAGRLGFFNLRLTPYRETWRLAPPDAPDPRSASQLQLLAHKLA